MGLGGGALSQLAQAFITRNTDLERRTLVVSAFDLQSKVAVVVGRVCYLPFNMLLALLLGQSVGGSVGSSAVDVHRYRLTIGLCFSFCGAGCVIILLGGAEFRRISRSNAAAAGGSTEEKDEAAAAAAEEAEAPPSWAWEPPLFGAPRGWGAPEEVVQRGEEVTVRRRRGGDGDGEERCSEVRKGEER
jgi:MFS family permease